MASDDAAFCWSLRGMAKGEWGRRCWDYLHLRAIRWHQRATPEQVRDEHLALRRIFQNLPCEECSQHALRHYWEITPDIRSNSTYHLWVFSFHNAVNERLRKPIFGYGQYQELYRDQLRRNGLV